MPRGILILVSIPILVTILTPYSSPAATLSVPGGFVNIQTALDVARSGDVVSVAPGTYGGPGNRDLDFRGRNVVVESTSGALLTVIDCGGGPSAPHRGVNFRHGEGPGAVLRGFTIRGGYAPGDGPSGLRVGGAVYAFYASPTIEDCILTANTARRGGAIYADNAGAHFARCTVSENTAENEGGGIYARGGVAPTFVRCAFAGNDAVSGGAICCDTASPLFTVCLIVDNTATDSGGGAYCMMASPTFEFATFAKNSAPAGGGLLASWLSRPTLQNCIVAFSRQGEALRCASSGSVSATCTDVFGNAGGDWIGCVATQASRDGNFSSDPLFCGASCRLRRGSPCLRTLQCGRVGTYGQGCVSFEPVATDGGSGLGGAPGIDGWSADGAAFEQQSSWGTLKTQFQTP